MNEQRVLAQIRELEESFAGWSRYGTRPARTRSIGWRAWVVVVCGCEACCVRVRFNEARSSFGQIGSGIGDAIGDCKSKQRALPGSINPVEHPLLSADIFPPKGSGEPFNKVHLQKDRSELMNTIETRILLSALDGEIPLTAVDDYGAQALKDPVARKQYVLNAVRSLLSHGFIALGQFDSTGGDKSAWTDWTGSIDEQLNQLSKVYTPRVDEWESWGFLCWIAPTTAGERAVHALAAEGDFMNVNREE